MIKSTLVLGIALLLFSATGFATSEKSEKATPQAKTAPQLAGMGFGALPVAQKHECASALSMCMNNCRSISGADCDVDCAADCEVCAMDLAADPEKVCRR